MSLDLQTVCKIIEMINFKRIIATCIICLKPYIFVILSINIAIFAVFPMLLDKTKSKNHSPIIFLGYAIAASFLLLSVALVRQEVENEVESLLVHFQCSRRGLRFLGVIGFHLIFIISIIVAVSSFVDQATPKQIPISGHRHFFSKYHKARYPNATIISKNSFRPQKVSSKFDTYRQPNRVTSVKYMKEFDRYLYMLIYKTTITTIIYSCAYFIIESIIAFYNDLNLVEFVHELFVNFVTITTGIDLGDYGAGEMHFNAFIERRIR